MIESPKCSQDVHKGFVLESVNGFDVINCDMCNFKHIMPIPSAGELEESYRDEYYVTDKPLYIERYQEDLEWWNSVYEQRYKILEEHLPKGYRRILDIGSGPGFFLLQGQKRGWSVKGIEPSTKAAEHSHSLGLDVENTFFDERNASRWGLFNVIHMGEVLEHLPEPEKFLRLISYQLENQGLICIIVPNDFNPFQLILRKHLGFDPWWVAPPHHINYFDFQSLSALVERCGFEVVHQEATFPIDMFLLMGRNYINNDSLGRDCHKNRMSFEKSLLYFPEEKRRSLYSSFLKEGIGREIVLFARVSR